MRTERIAADLPAFPSGSSTPKRSAGNWLFTGIRFAILRAICVCARTTENFATSVLPTHADRESLF
jgi:hypothetical protein